MFKEKNFNYTIEATDIKEKEKRLKEAIVDIQLAYADSLYHNPNQGKKFSEILKSINTHFLFPLDKVVNISEGREASFEDLAKAKQPYMSELDSLYDSQCQSTGDDSFEAIQQRLSPLKEYMSEVEKTSRSENPEAWQEMEARDEMKHKEADQVGLFQCCSMEIGKMDKNSEKLLEQKGVSSYDRCLDIQIPDLFTTQQKFSKDSLLKSFEDTAELIIDKYPETSVVVGHSWLFSSPAAQKIAPFEVLGEDTFLNWSQLIDKDGNIHKERFNKFVETGNLPYPSLFAYMKTEDFVKKFSKRKGEIELKQLQPEWAKKERLIEQEAGKEEKEFQNLWLSGKVKNHEDIIKMFDTLPTIKSRFKKAGVYDEFVNILSQHIGQSMTEINREQAEEMKNLRDKLKITQDAEKYITKKVVLE